MTAAFVSCGSDIAEAKFSEIESVRQVRAKNEEAQMKGSCYLLD